MKVMNYAKVAMLIAFFAANNVFCAFEIQNIKGNQATVVESAGLLGSKTEKLSVKKFNGHVLDIRGNDVGIEESDTCAVIKYDGADKVVCKSGRVIDNVGSKTGSATGTPPHLLYKNYIGSYVPKLLGTPSMPGAARRISYCIGSCEAK